MTSHVGIWVDHERAVIVSAAAGQVTTEVVESEVGSHPRYTAPREAGGEKRYEQRRGQELDRYYDTVIEHVPDADALLILGPGEAKLELKERFGHYPAHANRAIELETVGKLTAPQLVARVEQHFSPTAKRAAARER